MLLVDASSCKAAKFYFRNDLILLCVHAGESPRFVDRYGAVYELFGGGVVPLAIEDWPQIGAGAMSASVFAANNAVSDDDTVVETSSDPIGEPVGQAYRSFANREEFLPYVCRTIHAPRFFEDFYVTIDRVHMLGIVADGQFLDWATLLRECVFVDTGEPVGMPLPRSYDGPAHSKSDELATA